MLAHTKYINCPECHGCGVRYEVYYSTYTTIDNDGDEYIWDEPCEEIRACIFCDGIGKFSEGDYLILKLQGKV